MSLSDDCEVRDRAEKFGVTEDQLRIAAAKVGTTAKVVERELQSRL